MKRKRLLFTVGYLLIAMAVLITALVISHQAEIIKAQAAEVDRAAHLQQVEAAREETQTELDQRTEQLQVVEQRNMELEELLVNRARTYEIVTTGIQLASRESDVQLFSRSGRSAPAVIITGVNMPVRSSSGFTAKSYERAFERLGARGMAGTEEAYVIAEEEWGINSLVLAAIAYIESGGGSSKIAQDKNNLLGLGAYDSDPYQHAIQFNDKAGSIYFAAELLATHYLTPGGRYYHGDDLAAIGVCYATDPMWTQKVARVMATIARAAVGDPGALMAAAQNIYGGEL